MDVEVRRLDGLRILIVEDEPDAREVLQLLLEESGANVIAAENAFQALRQLDTQVFDAIVSDLGMPQMDGYQLIRRIRDRDDAARRTPAIALTAYSRENDRDKALLAGFQMHVSKPYDMRELTEQIVILTRGGPSDSAFTAER
ncbi:MAG: response regulator [Burkholderiales bacterium]|nr:response regulator [Burkholderiales bacterium]